MLARNTTRGATVLALFAAFTFCGRANARTCAGSSVGLVPLTELISGEYEGYSGGLYPGSVNERPLSHHLGGMAQSAAIAPLTAVGVPNELLGSIVLLTLGMSNCSYESDAFAALAESDPLRNPKLSVVNGAQPDRSAAEISDPNADFWRVVDQRLAERGFTPLQVQAVWFKETNEFPTESFPEFATILRDQFETIMRIIRDRYPNARLCYCSSRTYGGYASIALNPEPYAYQTGFAVKWLVEDQIEGDPGLEYDSSRGVVEAPWLSWGPYLWADGVTPRADGLTWECADFWESDGTHPSLSGTAKVATMLRDFFRTDATARGWYLSNPPTSVGTPDEAFAADAPRAAAILVLAPRPNPFNPHAAIPIEVRAPGRVRADVISASGRLITTLVDRSMAAGAYTLSWDGLDASGAPASSGTYVLRVALGGGDVVTRKLSLVR